MDGHNVTREALSLETVLNKISAHTLLLSMKVDMLFKEEKMIVLEKYLPKSTLVNIDSTHGHDSLLANADLIFEALGIFIDDNNIF